MRAWVRLSLAIAQFVLVAAAVGWLVARALDAGVLQPAWRAVPLLAVAVGLNALALAAMGGRFALLARSFPVAATGAGLATLNYRSLFWLFVLPLGMGMEAARYLGLRALAPDASRTAILGCVLVDRALGLAAAVPAAAFGWWMMGGHWGWLAAALAALAGGWWLTRRLTPLRPAVLAAGLVWAFVFHTLTYAAIWCACTALEVAVGGWQMLFAVAAGVVGALVPVALFGVQAGDLASAGLLAWLGVPTLAASMVAAITWASRLQGALTGAVLELRASGSTLRLLWAQRAAGETASGRSPSTADSGRRRRPE